MLYGKHKKVRKYFLISIFLILIAGIFVISVNWVLVLNHEAGHMKACELAGISCKLEYKTFKEYLFFSGYNLIFNTLGQSTEMEVIPEDKEEFCNLSFEKQQIIRIGGFRNDLKAIKFIQSFLFAELIIYFIFISRIVKKKEINQKTRFIIVIGLAIILLTALILLGKVIQLENYFSQNIKDLFYYPCNF